MRWRLRAKVWIATQLTPIAPPGGVSPPLSLRTMLSFHFLLSSRMQVSSTLNVPGLCPGGSLLRPQQESPFNTSADLALGTASWSELTSLGCCTVEDSATLLEERGSVHLCGGKVVCLIVRTWQ